MEDKKSPFDVAIMAAQKIALETLYIPPSLRHLYAVVGEPGNKKLVNVKTRD